LAQVVQLILRVALLVWFHLHPQFQTILNHLVVVKEVGHLAALLTAATVGQVVVLRYRQQAAQAALGKQL
jgi:hypothetical protein